MHLKILFPLCFLFASIQAVAEEWTFGVNPVDPAVWESPDADNPQLTILKIQFEGAPSIEKCGGNSFVLGPTEADAIILVDIVIASNENTKSLLTVTDSRKIDGMCTISKFSPAN